MPPALIRGRTPVREGERAVFGVSRPRFEARVSLPRRPRGWVVVAAPDEDLGGLEAAGPATVRVARPAGSSWEDALRAAAVWLRSLPEARGLPIAFAGAGEAGRRAAVRAAAETDSALVLDAEHDSDVALVPTHVGGDPAVIEAFLDAELGLASSAGALNHRRRRLLARQLERGMRREQRRRGGLSGHVRAGLAIAASALALTLSLGAASPASAAVEADYNLSTGELSFSSDSVADSLELTCTPDADGDGGDVSFSVNGGAPQGLPGPQPLVDADLECVDAVSITVEGNEGNDTLDLSAVNTDGTLGVDAEYINLHPGDVTIGGDGDADQIDGPQDVGSTSLTGGAGDDTLTSANSVGDTLIGGGGSDSVVGGVGNLDTISFAGAGSGITSALAAGTATGQGNDSLSGIENAIGSDHADSITGAVSPPSLVGNSGNDTLSSGAGAGTLSGDAGTDSLIGSSAADSLLGAADGDTLVGGGAAAGDTLFGDAGIDSLDGEAGEDLLDGGTEDDSLLGGDTADDTLDGDAGSDFAVYSNAAGSVTVDLGADSAVGAGTDTLTAIENAAGSPQADTLLGDTSANALQGLGAADSVSGNAGDDNVLGNGGDDTVNGGGSTDTASGGGGDDTVDASTGAGLPESLSGGTQDDSLSATSASGATLDGGDGQDTLNASNSQDDADGGPGTDSILGNGANDTLLGDGDADTISGGSGTPDDDSIAGGAQGDSLSAGVGDDTVAGDGENDTLLGSTGLDSLLGGAGTDTVQQLNADNPTLTNTSLTGEGPDTLNAVEAASLTGSGTFDASAFTGTSVTMDGSSGADVYRGSDGNDSVVANDSADRFEQTADADQALDDSLVTGNGNDTLVGTVRVSLTGGGSANDIDVEDWGGGLGVTVDGLGANDTLHTADREDSLVGGPGTDRVTKTHDASMTLTDTAIQGFSTDDTLSSIEQVSLTGGPGFSEFDAGAFTGSVTIDAGDGFDTVVPAAGSDSLDGGAGTADDIRQTTDAAQQTLTDTQLTGTGTDTIASFTSASLTGGASGNDIDPSGFTGAGSVILSGEGGPDRLGSRPAADDLLDGGGGTDTVAHASNDDSLTLQDTLLSAQDVGLRQDTLTDIDAAALTGGGDANWIKATDFTRGPVSLSGEGGNDTLQGTSASDSLVGGTETDSLMQSVDASQTLTDGQLTGNGTDTLATVDEVSLSGGGGANDIDASGFTGKVRVDAGAGDDTVAGADGDDTLDAGEGSDRLEQTANANQTLADSLATGDGTDTLTGSQFEQASLSGGADPNQIDANQFTGSTTIRGDAGADRLEGSATAPNRLVEIADADMTLTDTTLSVGGDDDTLDSDFQSVSLTAGASANDLDASGYTNGSVTLSGDANNDTLAGSFGNDDSLIGGTGTNTADYSANGTSIDANLGGATDTVDGGSTDTLSGVQNLIGSSFADTIVGDGGANTLEGGDGGDTITGGAGPDSLSGQSGADTQNSDDGGIADTSNCGNDGGNVANADFADTIVGCETRNVSPDPDPGGGNGGGSGGGGAGGGNGGGAAPVDTRAPLLSLSGKAKQSNKKNVKLKATPDEASSVEAEGTIKVPKLRNGGVTSKKKFDLKGADADLAAGQAGTLKLAFKKKAAKLVKKALGAKETSKAKVTVTATDAAGNASEREKLTVKVKK